ncbi:MAG: 4-alpha-glucanotransferase [Verrucomicrobia bacterium]|nr:4-alpha-glucanotransferase [Verrucomicrobiota bacterium]
MTHHGIDLPLSALRTQKSSGIGEFLDLLPLIDWCEGLGLDTIQLLPLNDSGHDPGPYNALSSCALHPIYLSLHALPGVKKLPDCKHLLSTPRVAYAEVLALKLDFLRTYIETTGPQILKDPAFDHFLQENPWAVSYGLFKHLKDRLGHTYWMSWPAEIKESSEKALVKKYWDEILFHILVQFLCFTQMSKVKAHSKDKKIQIMGDIPILISTESVDAWQNPDLFDFSLAAGAPPDAYNAEGQHWGFPLFNWDEMKKQNFAWWKERLKVASHYYDLYRIDHAVGFFRIWAIPHGKSPQEGKFIPENPALWIPQGKEILQTLLDASPMQAIAEDLGDVPPSVRTCLTGLGIPGTKVMRWEREYNDHGAYIPLEKYPRLSLTTVSTHDSETLQQWWQNDVESAKIFAAGRGWTYSPDLTFEHRLSILQDAHHTPSLYHVNLFQEYLALFPELVAPRPEDERINIPGKVLPTNWTYRLRPSLEDIVAHDPLRKCLTKVVQK